jgi:hypothetical protein
MDYTPHPIEVLTIPFWDVPIHLSTLKIAYVLVNYFTGLWSNITTFN